MFVSGQIVFSVKGPLILVLASQIDIRDSVSLVFVRRFCMV